PASRCEDASRLGHGGLGPREVEDAEVHPSAGKRPGRTHRPGIRRVRPTSGGADTTSTRSLRNPPAGLSDGSVLGGISTPLLTGDPVRRTVYAVTPPGVAHLL